MLKKFAISIERVFNGGCFRSRVIQLRVPAFCRCPSLFLFMVTLYVNAIKGFWFLLFRYPNGEQSSVPFYAGGANDDSEVQVEIAAE